MENFYILYGLEKGLIQNECNRIVQKLKIDDVVKYDMNTSSIVDIVEDLSTVGLFTGKKVLILEDAFFLGANKTIEQLESLEKYLEHYNSDNVCIFLSYVEKLDSRKKINKLLSKHKVMEFNACDMEYLEKYVLDTLKQEKYSMEDVSYFLKVVGSNFSNIQNELDKLMMYRIEEKKIFNSDIDKVTIRSMEEEIFALTDAIIVKDVQKSLTLLDNFLNRDYDEIQIIMLLASQFRFLFQVKRLMNKGKTEAEIAKILGANPYRVKFTLKKLYSYSEEELLRQIQRVAKMDHDIKLGIMNKKLALELFITYVEK